MDKPNFDLTKFFDRKNEIIKDEKVFEPSFIPENLIHRERELELLANHFKSIISRNSSISGKQVIIQGSVGLGKTALVTKFGITLEKYCRKKVHPNIVNIIFFHINCRRQRSWYLILTSILSKLVPAFPVRGFSSYELLTYLIRVLEERRQSLLLCLDEIDYLISNSKEQDVLYSLIRYYEESNREESAKLSLILVTRNPIFHNLLDQALKSSLSQKTIRFEPYTSTQLFDILENRAQAGLFKETYCADILKAMSSLAHEHGDARYAIELLWRAAKVAERERAQRIEFEHMRKAQVSIFPVNQSVIMELSPQLKTVLLALASLLHNLKHRAYVTSKEVCEKYTEICRQTNTKPRKPTQLWSYLQELSKYGLIELKVKNQRRNGKSAGRVTLIGIPDLPINDLLSLLE
ncbi:MAG: Cdc6/Cdc18 family protein [Candidatus Hodarchaeota archaeon]